MNKKSEKKCEREREIKKKRKGQSGNETGDFAAQKIFLNRIQQQVLSVGVAANLKQGTSHSRAIKIFLKHALLILNIICRMIICSEILNVQEN